MADGLEALHIVADENVPKPLVDHLRTLGFKKVEYIQENQSGISDPEVWNYAASIKAVLITFDFGFVKQLSKEEIIDGPRVIVYGAVGFSKKPELRDAVITNWIFEWLFRKRYDLVDEYLSINLKGKRDSKRQLWGKEKQRRKRSP